LTTNLEHRHPGQPNPDHALSRRRRITVLLICCMSLLIVGMDNTIVNVALPSIGREFHASVAGLQWTIDAYVVVLASLLMLSGSMADRFGRRRIFQLGLVIFTLASFLCSRAPSLEWLVAFRILQAVGGSMLNPVAMSIIRNTFEDPRERAQAIGVWGAVVGVSLALGPVIGGVLVQTVGWRAIFLVNLPVGVAAIVLTACFVPESRAPQPRRIDPVGQVLVILILGSLTYAIIEGPGHGWASPEIVGLLVVFAVSLLSLLWYEPRRREPLIAAFSGFLFLNTLYLQDVRGLSALDAGLITLPMAAMTMIVSPLAGALVGRRGARIPLMSAGVALTLGSVMLVGLTDTTSYEWLVASYLIFGIGFGLVNPPITNTAVSGMPPAQAGVAAAVASTSRQVGQALGVAVIGVAATAGLNGQLGHGLAKSSHPGWWIVVACSASVLVLGYLSTTPRAYRSAARIQPLFES